MKESHINTVAEYIQSVMYKIDSMKPEGPIWFRGEASHLFKLVPNLFRTKASIGNVYCSDILNPLQISRVEQNIDMSFFRKSNPFFTRNGIENTPWNRYFLKQHYGVKTRLLDWTENALVALYFAVTSNSEAHFIPKISILSPIKLNQYTISLLVPQVKEFKGIFTCRELTKPKELFSGKNTLSISELLRKYYRLDCKVDEKMYPIAIYPPHLDERMSAQQTCFTLFGNVADGLGSLPAQEKYVEFVTINSDKRNNIINELKLLGITEYFVKPDLDGLGRSINQDSFHDLHLVQEENEFSHFLSKMEQK